MRVLIIEDEQHTAKRLKKMIQEIDPEIEIAGMLDSIESSINWLKTNPRPNLIIQDIHLADGSAFEIYNTLEITTPVIFTTAYDEYAIDAFKVNSIDYLLKPVNKETLEKSIKKFKKIIDSGSFTTPDYLSLGSLINPPKFQKRFMIRYGQKIKVINTRDIAYFFAREGLNFFKTFDNNEFPSDFSLDKLEKMLDPEFFFRINRQFIVSIDSIGEMYSYSKSRVKIELNPPCEIETISSTERSGKFKKWLSGDL